jgi:tetratricopeptide (TPR) repeat protein
MKRRAAESQPVRVFYSYAHEDEALCETLQKHLRLLQRQGLIQSWYDRKIPAGSGWQAQIDQHLDTAQVILLLISPDFLQSDYCHDIEMRQALERHATGEAWVIPIHLRPVDIEGAAFAELQALPTDAKPVTTWDNPDKAFQNIARGIRHAVQEIRRLPPGAPIVHTDLVSPPRRTLWIWGSVACLLLIIVVLGGYSYHQHTTQVATHLQEGKRLLATGQYAQARQAYQQALARSWFGKGAARLGLEKASVYDAPDGEFRPLEVKQRIDRILTQHPDDPHAHLFLGDLYAIQDDYTTASTHYEQAIARDPTLAHGYFSLGVVYDKLGKVEQSLQMYERAATLADWHQPYLNNLAYQYLQHQDYDKARATYERALQLDGQFLLTYFDLANYFRALGQPQQALQYLEKGVALLDDPKVAALEKNQGTWYFHHDADLLHLDTLPRKQCYAYHSLTAMRRLLQRTTEGAQKLCALDSVDARDIQEWVEAENHHIGNAR